MNARDIGFQVRIERWQAGVKQFQLASMLGMRASQLCEIENGRATAPEGMLECVRAALANKAEVNA
ncbi:hypothetical protein AYO38_05580 [bacterium SCGC AG-212-C10]|nr:hypothetical protein AYO38_05580 [bacterium SCGC AG-212-C10]